MVAVEIFSVLKLPMGDQFAPEEIYPYTQFVLQETGDKGQKMMPRQSLDWVKGHGLGAFEIKWETCIGTWDTYIYMK